MFVINKSCYEINFNKRPLTALHFFFFKLYYCALSWTMLLILLMLFFKFLDFQMRLKKLPELIHKSDALPDCEQATVAVYFQEIIDYLVYYLWYFEEGGMELCRG